MIAKAERSFRRGRTLCANIAIFLLGLVFLVFFVVHGSKVWEMPEHPLTTKVWMPGQMRNLSQKYEKVTPGRGEEISLQSFQEMTRGETGKTVEVFYTLSSIEWPHAPSIAYWHWEEVEKGNIIFYATNTSIIPDGWSEDHYQNFEWEVTFDLSRDTFIFNAVGVSLDWYRNLILVISLVILVVWSWWLTTSTSSKGQKASK
jgi:hypothetical protein